MKLLLCLSTSFVLARAQFPNDLIGCTTAGSNIASCLIDNLSLCAETSCDTAAPGLDGDTPCDETVACQVVQDCCEPCRQFSVDFMNNCGSCTESFECTFAPAAPSTTPPREPCEQAALDITQCSISTENRDECTLCTVVDTQFFVPPFDCSTMQQDLCVTARENCCETCRNAWDRYVQDCFFDLLPFADNCSCEGVMPGPPTAPVSPPPTSVPFATPTEPPVQEGGPTVDPGIPTTSPPSMDNNQVPTVTPTSSPTGQDFVGSCQAETVAMDECAKTCPECEDKFESRDGMISCSALQEDCAIGKECCPQCLSDYNDLLNCIFQTFFNTPCTCDGSSGGDGSSGAVATNQVFAWITGGLLLLLA